MDIKVDNVYVTTAECRCEPRDDTGDVVILKGHRVKVLAPTRFPDIFYVEDLEDDRLVDGRWFVKATCLAECDKSNEPKQDNNYDQHYQGKVEPIELMQAQMTQAELIGFLKGNIIKYATRCGKKDDPAKEVSKIKRYADWLLDVLEGRTIDPRS